MVEELVAQVAAAACSEITKQDKTANEQRVLVCTRPPGRVRVSSCGSGEPCRAHEMFVTGGKWYSIRGAKQSGILCAGPDFDGASRRAYWCQIGTCIRDCGDSEGTFRPRSRLEDCLPLKGRDGKELD
jgi:hypothetical protein